MNKTVIIKTTSSCNMACAYCYEDCPNIRDSKLSIDTFKKFLNQLLDLSNQNDRINLIWHGGEPLLMGLDYYQEAVDLATYFSKLCNIEIQHSIQTNGTLLTEEFIEFFLENKFRLGFSLDGPQIIHDSQRIDKSGKGTFKKVMNAINLWQQRIKQHQIYSTSVIAVITKTTLLHKDDFFSFFLDNGINVKVNPVMIKGNAFRHPEKLQLSVNEYEKFLLFLWESWIHKDKPKFMIQPFDSIIRSMITQKADTCTFMGKCGSSFLSLDYDGNILPCGRWAGKENSWGNIINSSLTTILSSKNASKFLENMAIIPNDCLTCKYYRVCHSGCSANRFYMNNAIMEKTYYCQAYKKIFRKAEKFISQQLSFLED